MACASDTVVKQEPVEATRPDPIQTTSSVSSPSKPVTPKKRKSTESDAVRERPGFGLDLPEPPAFRPTVKEFESPLEYLASIRPIAAKYGICRVIPPPQWKPTCALNEATFKFSTRLQRTHQLSERRPEPERFLEILSEHLETEGIDLEKMPTIAGIELDLHELSRLVKQYGGLQEVINRNKWSKIADELRLPRCPKREDRLQLFYYKFLLSWDMLSPDQKREYARRAEESRLENPPEPFGYPTGRTFTLPQFQKHAEDFKAAWFRGLDPSLITPQRIEDEYWKIVDGGEHYVCVNYGSDIDSTVHGSGFATSPSDPYSRFGWNLNVLPGLPQSILKHISGISGISMPWLYVGMLFSSFCWHVEDNFLYSINYMHFGADKTWYGVPGSAAPLMEHAFRKLVPRSSSAARCSCTTLSPLSIPCASRHSASLCTVFGNRRASSS